MNLLSWSWGVWMDRKRSGQFGSWEGGQGLRLRKKQSVSISVYKPSSIGIHQSLNLGDGTELSLADVEESEDGISSVKIGGVSDIGEGVSLLLVIGFEKLFQRSSSMSSFSSVIGGVGHVRESVEFCTLTGFLGLLLSLQQTATCFR